jgi:hypothetical protein
MLELSFQENGLLTWKPRRSRRARFRRWQADHHFPRGSIIAARRRLAVDAVVEIVERVACM